MSVNAMNIIYDSSIPKLKLQYFIESLTCWMQKLIPIKLYDSTTRVHFLSYC
jgi:hypothetical protein